MKKLMWAAIAAILVVAAGCHGKSIAGHYEAQIDGAPGGASGSGFSLDMNADNTFKATMMGQSQDGTWAEKDKEVTLTPKAGSSDTTPLTLTVQDDGSLKSDSKSGIAMTFKKSDK
jgi:hypothetical protein